MKNEEVKKFPQDFIAASMQWVRSWFLTDKIKAGGYVTVGDANLGESRKKACFCSKSKRPC